LIVCIPAILSPAELDEARARAAEARFVDGQTTAGWHARQVKRNEQAAGDDTLPRLVERALQRNEVFRAAALPRRLAQPLVARYRPGMTYGAHVDNAIMGETNPLRSDIAVTVFLAAPDSYAGGELVIESTGGEQEVKLEAGAAVLYPATTLHRVTAVTAGERLVAVTWVQSLVRDAARREVLFELDAARREIFATSGKTPVFDRLAKSYANLLRMWAEV
jgi:PKHD-type hydroxylase